MIVINGYILAIEKTDADYNELHQIIMEKPADPEGYQYRLRVDTHTWELVELPPAPEPDPEAEISDYEQALADLGVRLE